MHLTLGILRQSQAVFYALSFFWLDGFAVPTPAQVTQTVGQLLAIITTNMLTVKETLPDFWMFSKRIANDLQNGQFPDKDSLIQQILPLLDKDYVEKTNQVIPGWKTIANLNDGQTALHTFLVFTLCLNLNEYLLADEQTRLEIEWAAILHDLDKKIARQDTAHPFRSAAIASQIMPSLGFELAPNISKTDIDSWANLVMTAQRPDGARMIHDHSSLLEIVKGIHTCWGNDTSPSRILKAVLFHQSLPTLKEWSNPVLLTDKELAFSLTLNDMNILGALMIADSDSWAIFSEVRNSYLYELRQNIAETRNKIQNVVKLGESSSQ